ncbi:MAG: 1-aminocyclopropane-1-carboxylate deaminase/D-cysteine desulfhydrase [Bacteroidetes bacterium]|nr:1-aminocyclopropane-1-carboxylate deaminase/D-cysteine desulfhydrase [Bacteroidota bacterium]
MKIPLQKISDPAISSSGVNLFVLRLDLTHPHISGNKWYKLKYNLEEIKKQKIKTVLTFGGAYSNHIAATAAAGKKFKFKTIGIIRGNELTSALIPLRPRPQPLSQRRGEKQPVNHTLQFAKECGMKLHFVSRAEYRKKHTPEFLSTLTQQFGKVFIIPEGGSNEFGVKGCTEIVNEINSSPSLISPKGRRLSMQPELRSQPSAVLREGRDGLPFDFICSACGTGATLAGIILSLKKNQQAIGFSVLHASGYIESEVKKWLARFKSNSFSNFHINEDYDFGKYAKHTPELLEFINCFEKQNNIPLDQVYTGKMMFGIYDLIKKNYFPKGSTVIAVHTGGLQGKLNPSPALPSRERD